MLMSTYTNSAVVLLLIVFSKADAWWRRRHRSSPPSPLPRDTTPPEFSNCPLRWTVRVAGTSTDVTWTEPTARDDRPVRRKRRICGEYDNCDTYPGYRDRTAIDHYAVTPSRSGPPSGSTFTEGQHSIVYTARDLAGNTATCTVRFTVVTIRCPLIDSLPQRFVTCSNGNIATSTCKFSCATGYNLLGSSSVRCIKHYGTFAEGGSWSRSLPTCRIHDCREPYTPYYGSKSCTSYKFGGRCTFRCRVGYSLSGLSSITCSEDSWSGRSPNCRDTQAPTFTNCPEDIIVTNSDREVWAVVRYTLPSAVDNSGHPPSIRKTYGPSSGERFFSGRRDIQYRATDLSGNRADCSFSVTVRVVYCPDITSQQGRRSFCNNRRGTLKGTTCNFICEDGYTISGAATILCGANGQWDREFPNCIAITCRVSSLTVPTNAYMRPGCSGSIASFHQECFISCYRGYKPNTRTRYVCTADEHGHPTWSGRALECTITTCDTMSPPFYGSITGCRRGSSSVPVTGPHTYDTTCDIACNTGYILSSGPESLTCLANGRWDAKRPVCSVIACALSSFPITRNGEVTGCSASSIALGDGCYLSCHRGHQPSTPTLRVCQDDGSGQGVWSGGIITCSLVSCNTLVPPSNGRITGCYRGRNYAVAKSGPHLFGTRCFIGCNAGFTLASSYSSAVTLTCFADGQWDREQPLCTRTE